MSFRTNVAAKPQYMPTEYAEPPLLSPDVETDLRLLEVRLMGHTNRLMGLGLWRPSEEAESLLRDLRRVMGELNIGLI